MVFKKVGTRSAKVGGEFRLTLHNYDFRKKLIPT